MNLKNLRCERGLSQAALAKKAQVAQSSICYLESGQKNPSVRMAIKLAKALEVDLTTLIES